MLPRAGARFAGRPRRSCDAWHTMSRPTASEHSRTCLNAAASACLRSICTPESQPHSARRGHPRLRPALSGRTCCSPPNSPAPPPAARRGAHTHASTMRTKELVAPLTAGPGVIGRPRPLPRTSTDFRSRCHAKGRGFAGLTGGIRDASQRTSPPFVLRPVGAQFSTPVKRVAALADHILEPALTAQTGEGRIGDVEDFAGLGAIN